MELRKPDLPYTLVNLLNEKIITEDDLNQFSSELQGSDPRRTRWSAYPEEFLQILL